MMELQYTDSAAVCQHKINCLFWPCFTWPGGPARPRTAWPQKGGAAYDRMTLLRDCSIVAMS